MLGQGPFSRVVKWLCHIATGSMRIGVFFDRIPRAKNKKNLGKSEFWGNENVG